MALTDPQSVTINGVATSLPRITAGVNQSSYQSNDGLVKLAVSHTYGRRTRRVIRLDQAKIAADPFAPSVNQKFNNAVYLVVDTPVTGFTVAEAKYDVDALLAALSASSGALITKLLGGEN